MPASSPSNIDFSTSQQHDDSSPSIRTHPLDLDPSQTSTSIPTSHLIHENVEPIARLQHERVVQELKRISSMSSSSIPSPVLIPIRTPAMDGRQGQTISTGYASPLPMMDEHERERQLASPLPSQQEQNESADIILSSPAFAMSQTPQTLEAPVPVTTIPLTTSNLAQHDRIISPVHHPTTQTHSQYSTATTTHTQSIPAYRPH